MTPMLKLAAMACAAMLATGTACAQGGPPAGGGAPAGPGYTAENNTVRNGGDTSDRDAEQARRDAIEAARLRDRNPKAARSGPAKPEEVIAGAEVRDPKGKVVGRIESVSVGSAVIVTDLGKVEVPLEAFGKDSKGLLIPMSKADFDKAVTEANKTPELRCAELRHQPAPPPGLP